MCRRHAGLSPYWSNIGIRAASGIDRECIVIQVSIGWTGSELIIASPQTGHDVQVDEPGLVVEAIQRMVDVVR